MKKIMFNDKYSLTQAVLDGRKTMTRRIFYIPDKLVPYLNIDDMFDIVDNCIIWKDKVGGIRMTFEPNIRLAKLSPLHKVIWMLTDFIEKGKMRLT